MIKKIFTLLVFSFAITYTAFAQRSVRVVNNDAFSYGEKITYKVKYNLYFNIYVGEVDFNIDNKPQQIAGNDCYHITGTGRTFGFYDPFYKERDKYQTYLEKNSLLPLLFIRDVQEGKFSFNEYVLFNHAKKLAQSKKRLQTVPAYTQDVLSAIYYARTFDYDNAKPGQTYGITAFIDDSAYRVGVKYMGKETINTNLGDVRCIKLKPILIVDRLFKANEGMTLWVTDDANHVPVRIESGISVGKIRADLDTYSGLKNPMTALR